MNIIIKISDYYRISCFNRRLLGLLLFFIFHSFTSQLYISTDAQLNLSKGTIIVINENYTEDSKILDDKDGLVIYTNSVVKNIPNNDLSKKKLKSRKASEKNNNLSLSKKKDYLPKNPNPKEDSHRIKPIPVSEYFTDDSLISHLFVANTNFHYSKSDIEESKFVFIFFNNYKSEIFFPYNDFLVNKICDNHLFARPPPIL